MYFRQQRGWQTARLLLPLFVSLTALGITLIAVGDVSSRFVAGLPHSPLITLWLLPASRLVADVSGLIMVGGLLVAGILWPRDGASLSDGARKIADIAGYSAFTYAVSNVLLVIFAVSDILGVTPIRALDMNVLRSYLTQVTGGRVSLFQITTALLVSLLATRVRQAGSSYLLLIVALISAAAPAFTGHSGLSSHHEIAASSLALHIMALSLWVGGLVVLSVAVSIKPPDFGLTVTRFSRIAFGCYAAVILSGAANAWVRLRSINYLFGSNFGRLVLAKISLALLLGYLGWLHRSRSLPSIREGAVRIFYRIAAVEVAIMLAIVGIAVTLSRTGFPQQALTESITPTASELLYGYKLPPTPTLGSLLLQVRPDLLWLAFALTLLTAYLTAVRRVRNAGLAWSRSRTTSFAFGILLMIFATSGGLASYAHVLFSAHMVQHIVLLLAVPEFLVAGQPFRVALLAHSLGNAASSSFAADILGSRTIKWLSRLPITTALFAASFFVLYFTPLFAAWMPSHWGHVAMEVIIFGIGYLFVWNLFGSDERPIRHSDWSRMRALVIAEPFHILFSVLLIWSHRLLGEGFYASLRRPYAGDLHHDQILGGILGWLTGELPMLLAAVLLLRALAKSSASTTKTL